MNKQLLILSGVALVILSTTIVMADKDDHEIDNADCSSGLVNGNLSSGKECQSFAGDVLHNTKPGCKQTRRGLRCN